MPTISSASVRLATTATDTVAPSTISTPLLLLLPVGRYWHHGRTLGGPSHPWKPRPEPVGGSATVRPPGPWPLDEVMELCQTGTVCIHREARDGPDYLAEEVHHRSS